MTPVYGTNPDALNPAAGQPSGVLVSMTTTERYKALIGGQKLLPSSTVDLALEEPEAEADGRPAQPSKPSCWPRLIKAGYAPTSVFPAPAEVVLPHGNQNGTPWKVTNFEHESTAPTMSLVDATADSINTVYAQVVARLGASTLDSMAEALGIDPAELPGAYPSQVLRNPLMFPPGNGRGLSPHSPTGASTTLLC